MSLRRPNDDAAGSGSTVGPRDPLSRRRDPDDPSSARPQRSRLKSDTTPHLTTPVQVRCRVPAQPALGWRGSPSSTPPLSFLPPPPRHERDVLLPATLSGPPAADRGRLRGPPAADPPLRPEPPSPRGVHEHAYRPAARRRDRPLAPRVDHQCGEPRPPPRRLHRRPAAPPRAAGADRAPARSPPACRAGPGALRRAAPGARRPSLAV